MAAKSKQEKRQQSAKQARKLQVMDADSSVAIPYSIRPPKAEKGIIVSDSDWDDIVRAYNKLDDVNNDYYTWSGICFSISASTLISLIITLFDKREEIINYIPSLIMFIVIILTTIGGIILVVKGKGKSSTIESAKESLKTVLERVEKKTSGLENIHYYDSTNGDNV